LVNRRIPNGTYGGVRGRGLGAPSYSIKGIWEDDVFFVTVVNNSAINPPFFVKSR